LSKRTFEYEKGLIGLGANRPQDAVYPTSTEDADGPPEMKQDER
jgi:hypothetical protein